MLKLMKISDMIFDKKIYPRQEACWQTILSYSKAMKLGSKFPPINVGLYDDKYYIVDGVHRIEACKNQKIEDIQANVKKYDSFDEMYLDSVRLNSTHGRAFSYNDRLIIADKLEKIGLGSDQISKLVGIEAEKIKLDLNTRKVTDRDGKVILLKSPLVKMKENVVQAISDGMQIGNLQKKLVGTKNHHIILDSMLLMLRTHAFDIGDGRIKLKLVQIKKLIDKEGIV